MKVGGDKKYKIFNQKVEKNFGGAIFLGS